MASGVASTAIRELLFLSRYCIARAAPLGSTCGLAEAARVSVDSLSFELYIDGTLNLNCGMTEPQLRNEEPLEVVKFLDAGRDVEQRVLRFALANAFDRIHRLELRLNELTAEVHRK